MYCRIAVLVLFLAYASGSVNACTSLLVTKGASEDGSVMITYTADAAGFYPRLIVMPAEEHPEGTVIEVPETDDRPAGAIKQALQTYHVIGVTWDPEPGFRRGEWLKQGLINEHQVAITESTFGGRPELRNPQGLTSYSMLITLALQRAKTAREAIDVITSLAEEYGYHDTGESFSIADKEEAWVLELIGTGPKLPPAQIGSRKEVVSADDHTQQAGLRLEIMDPVFVTIDGEVDFLVEVTNLGKETAKDVDLKVSFGSGLKPLASSTSPGVGRAGLADNGMVVATISTIAAGTTEQFIIRFAATREGDYRIKTEVTCEDTGVHLESEPDLFTRNVDGERRMLYTAPRQPGGMVVWVAKKVPDGEISAHANQARIGIIPDEPDRDNCFYSDNIRSFAIEKGWYNPASGEPFRFNYVYGDITASSKRSCETRVWSIFRRVAPSQANLAVLSPDYHRGVPGAKPYPWSIKPDKKLSVADVFALKRDHYEGTDFDMSKGIDAGAFGLPLRWRPLYWYLKSGGSEPPGENDDETEYAWERPISTQQTGFSVVSQSRSHLPDMVGGVLWYGVDDTYTTCYFPLYCQITEVPKPFATGSIEEFSWDSAWWVFNLVANYANLKFDRITPEIIKVQQELETRFLTMQPLMEKNVLEMYEADAMQARQALTYYSVYQGELVFSRWQRLAIEIFTKFNDGYIRADDGTYPREGDPYPDGWLRNVVEERPEQFKLPRE